MYTEKIVDIQIRMSEEEAKDLYSDICKGEIPLPGSPLGKLAEVLCAELNTPHPPSIAKTEPPCPSP